MGNSTQWEIVWANDGLSCYARRYNEGVYEENHPENGYAFNSMERDDMAGQNSEYQLCYRDIAITFNA